MTRHLAGVTFSHSSFKAPSWRGRCTVLHCIALALALTLHCTALHLFALVLPWSGDPASRGPLSCSMLPPRPNLLKEDE